MKSLYLLTLFALMLLLPVSAISQVCQPDPQYANSPTGIYPVPANNRPIADICRGSYFEYSFTGVVQDTTNASGFPIVIELITVNNIRGLPTGLSYACPSSQGCNLTPGTLNCGIIYGTVSDTVAPRVFDFVVDVTVFLAGGVRYDTSIPGPFLSQQLKLRVTNCDGGCGLTVNRTALPPSCFGQSDGQATVMPNGGAAPYTYKWNAAANNQTTATATNLAAGDYQVTVTDNAGCEKIQTVTVPPAPAFSALITNQLNISCFSGSLGAATVQPVGGVAPYRYKWSNGNTTNMATGLTAGTYGVTITDFKNCEATTTVTIRQNTTLTASIINQVNPSCSNGNNGSATAVASQGMMPYTYKWSTGAVTATINNLVAGTYTVTITDAAGCTATSSVNLTNPDGINVTIVQRANISCNGGNNGSLEATHTGGVGPFSYTWSNGANTKIITNLTAGMYRVTVTGAGPNACPSTSSFTIQQPAALLPNATATNVTASGANDGTAKAMPSGGSAPYSYRWSTGSTQSMISSLAPGNYTVTVTGSDGCTGVQTVTVSDVGCALNLTTSKTDVQCNAGNNGTATVAATGGTGALVYTWSNGGNTATIQNLVAGTYTVTVTAGGGCQATSSVTITQPNRIVPTLSSKVDVACRNQNTGSATISVSGGKEPYRYNWPTGSTTNTEMRLNAGQYIVTITDGNNCTATFAVLIEEPNALTASITGLVNVSCTGSNSGMASVAATGGVPPYNYSWSNSNSTATATNLSAGTYTVTVTDANVCSTTLSVQISESESVRATIGAKTDVNCNGGTDGTATLEPSGGTAPYSYIWSNGATTRTQTQLAAGNYSITINDANNCKGFTTVTITQPEKLLPNASATRISDVGQADGTARAVPSGGVMPYTYRWSNGATTSQINNLPEGSYTVTVTDFNNCTATQTVRVRDNNCVLNVNATALGISCKGAANGQATVEILDGDGATYTYLWSNGATTQSISGLATGTYTVTVMDETGCDATSSVIITEPEKLAAMVWEKTDVSCNGGNDGGVNIIVSGGTPPYLYNWSNGANLETVSNLSAGTYHVTVVDARSCIVEQQVVIEEPAGMTVSLTNKTDVRCNGAANGSATVFVSGGAAPYSYLWSTGGTMPTEHNMPVGTHTVTVTDDNGCTKTLTVTLVAPQSFSIEIADISDVRCNGQINGTATVVGSGGTAPYNYLWSNAATTAQVNNLAAGNYSVTATDVNGCIATNSILIIEPARLRANATAVHETADNANNGTATAAPTGGTPPYTYRWSNSETTATITNLAPGTYHVTVTDSNSCTITETVTVRTFQCSMVTSQISVTNASCANNNNGSATVSLNGGQTPFTYRWSNGATGATVNNLAAGSYTVTVTDNGGCEVTENVDITVPPPLIGVISSVTKVDCSSITNGSATVTASGGVPPYRYQWSEGSTGATVTGLSTGAYTVTVLDANNCDQSVNVTIGIKADEEAPTARAKNLTVYLNANGIATITAAQLDNGSTDNCEAVTVSISQTTFTCEDTGVNQVAFTARDESGNSSTVTAIVTVRDTIKPQIVCPADIVTNSCDQLQIVNYPLPNIIDNCNNITPVLTTGLPSGATFRPGTTVQTYVATDASGNRASCSFTVTNNALSLKIDKSDPTCTNFPDGSATAIPTSGSRPFNFRWSNGETDSMITDLAAGTYLLTLTDVRNCSLIDSVILNQPPVLDIRIDSVQRATNNDANGAIRISPLGGRPPYTYEWTRNGAIVGTTEDLIGVGPGTYVLRLIDDSGCNVQSDPITVGTITGTTTIEWEQGVFLRPNPTAGDLYLELELQQVRDVQITLHDVTGKLLKPLSRERLASKQFAFDLSDYESGLYFLRIQADNQVVTRKIIVMKE